MDEEKRGGEGRGERRRTGEKGRLDLLEAAEVCRGPVVRLDWNWVPVHVALRGGGVRFSRLNRLPEGDVVQCRFVPLVQRFDRNRQLEFGRQGGLVQRECQRCTVQQF
jgi:hypothetical protein